MKINCFKKQLIILILCSITMNLFSQDIPHPIRNTGVYDFLDELANNQVITINSAIKPYSRSFIAKCLQEAEEKKDQLNTRQQKELEFYMMDFWKEMENGMSVRSASAQPPHSSGWQSKASADEGYDGAMVLGYPLKGGREGEMARSSYAEASEDEGGREMTNRQSDNQTIRQRTDLFYYQDSLFSLTINPILVGELFTNSAGEATYWRNGLEARAYAGKWGFYASLRDNHEKPLLGLPEYLTQREGGHLKGSTDWSEMQGGVTWSWKWGNAGFVKDNFTWGSNYNGANIFGGNNPSFVHLRLQLYPVKWFNFNYVHGWLNSMVVDSSRSFYVTNNYGTDYREVYHRKFMAANMLTFTPFRYLNISAGNSIIYDNATVNPAFLLPLMFYKSVDHSVSSGIDNMNSQMFFDVSSRQIRHLHIYATLFVDELSVSRIFEKDEWNFVSWKTGFRVSGFPVQNLSFTTEFTYTYPLTYQHYVTTTTFESNNYNLGHYLKDNSREWYAALDYRPLRTLNIKLWFIDAIRGPDYTELGGSRLGNPPLDTINWQNTTTGLRASYQVINDLYVWLSASHSNISGDVRWSPVYLQGKKSTFNFGITFGF